MSLINEALKRAKQAQAENAPTRPALPALRPVEAEKVAQTKSFSPVWPLGLATLGLAGLVVLFVIWKKDAAPRPGSGPAPIPVSAKTSAPAPVVTAADTAKTSVAPSRSDASIPPSSVATERLDTTSKTTDHTLSSSSTQMQVGATNFAVAATDTSDSNRLAVLPTAPVPPPLKLQSIVFNPRQPSALISGHVVFVGDRLRDFRVMAIHRGDVLLVGQGITNTLALEP